MERDSDVFTSKNSNILREKRLPAMEYLTRVIKISCDTSYDVTFNSLVYVIKPQPKSSSPMSLNNCCNTQFSWLLFLYFTYLFLIILYFLLFEIFNKALILACLRFI